MCVLNGGNCNVCIYIYMYTANCLKIWAHVYWKRIEDEESKAFGVKRESQESCFLIAFTPQENKHRLVWYLTSASGWRVFLTSSKKLFLSCCKNKINFSDHNWTFLVCVCDLLLLYDILFLWHDDDDILFLWHDDLHPYLAKICLDFSGNFDWTRSTRIKNFFVN